MRVLDLFSGIGGLSLGLERAGMRTIAFCEIEPFCRAVLAKHWPEVPQYDDVRAITGARLAADGLEPDVICGGFPCQDISYAGPGGGLSGSRSGLWWEFARIIGEVGPRYVLVENVAALLDRGMGEVLGTLSDLGFDAEWSVVSACALGAAHMRRRVFIVAYANGQHGREGVRHPASRPRWPLQTLDSFASSRARARARLENPSALYGGADGLPHGMDRNHAIGNAVAPDVAEYIARAIIRSETERTAGC